MKLNQVEQNRWDNFLIELRQKKNNGLQRIMKEKNV